MPVIANPLRLLMSPVCPVCFLVVETTREAAHEGEKAWNDPDARWVCRCRYCGWIGVTATTERVSH